MRTYNLAISLISTSGLWSGVIFILFSENFRFSSIRLPNAGALFYVSQRRSSGEENSGNHLYFSEFINLLIYSYVMLCIFRQVA